MDSLDLLKKYHISQEDFEKTCLDWDDLLKIKEEYEEFRNELEETTKYILEALHKFKKVHSIRYRIKDSEHLIEKIIRKKIEDENVNITIDNYKSEITDLIGFRILHLFKEDWLQINESIINKWDLNEEPIAYIREGDDTSRFEPQIKTKIHKYNYRSVHYNIKSTPSKQTYLAEIQVRTIYEEAWSEIDHNMRYPYDRDNPILLQYLNILNSLSGSADEMGSYIIFLKKEIQKIKEENARIHAQNQQTIAELKKRLSSYELKEENNATTLEEELDKLLSQININTIDEDSFVFDLPEIEDVDFSLAKPVDFSFLDDTSVNLNIKNNKGKVSMKDNTANNSINVTETNKNSKKSENN